MTVALYVNPRRLLGIRAMLSNSSKKNSQCDNALYKIHLSDTEPSTYYTQKKTPMSAFKAYPQGPPFLTKQAPLFLAGQDMTPLAPLLAPGLQQGLLLRRLGEQHPLFGRVKEQRLLEMRLHWTGLQEAAMCDTGDTCGSA